MSSAGGMMTHANNKYVYIFSIPGLGNYLITHIVVDLKSHSPAKFVRLNLTQSC
jgi:hypothetical protein